MHEHTRRVLRNSQPPLTSVSVEDKENFAVDLGRKRQQEMSNAFFKHHSLILYGWIKIRRTEICAVQIIDSLQEFHLILLEIQLHCVPFPQVTDVSQINKFGTSLNMIHRPQMSTTMHIILQYIVEYFKLNTNLGLLGAQC